MKFIKHLFFISIIFSCKTSVDSNPNFIFIYTDDQRFDALGIMSNENVITPNLDELAKSGAILTNVYNMGGYHGAVCVASRSMMISDTKPLPRTISIQTYQPAPSQNIWNAFFMSA